MTITKPIFEMTRNFPAPDGIAPRWALEKFTVNIAVIYGACQLPPTEGASLCTPVR